MTGNIDYPHHPPEIGLLVRPEDNRCIGGIGRKVLQCGPETGLVYQLLSEMVLPFPVHRDFVGLNFLGGRGRGLWQGNVNSKLMAESRGNHKKDQEQKHHINKRRDIDDYSPCAQASVKSAIHKKNTRNWLFPLLYRDFTLKFSKDATWRSPGARAGKSGAIEVFENKHVPLFSVSPIG